MNTTNKCLAGAVALLIASPAAASPTLLNCWLKDTDNTIVKIDTQFNEEGGTVSYSFPDFGRSYTVRAIFTPSQVSFGGFTVSRTDLSLKRANDTDIDRVENYPPYSYGRCVINKTPRAF